MDERFYNDHPHPLLDISAERVVICANPRALQVFGPNIVGRKCCEVLFGSEEACIYRCIEIAQPGRYDVKLVAGLKENLNDKSDEHYMTLFGYPGAGCHVAIHPVPQSFERVRKAVRVVTNKMIEATSIDEVIRHFRDFLVQEVWRPAYRVREYLVDNPAKPRKLQCSWHEAGVEVTRPYVMDLVGREIQRSTREGRVSFYAVEEFCVVLVSYREEDKKIFRSAFGAKLEPTGLLVVHKDPFRGLTLLEPDNNDQAVRIFREDEQPHCWLDIPFGRKGNAIRKISITPQGRAGFFSREEMEEILTIHGVANTQIENIQAREKETKLAKLDSIHEVSQPAFLALASIEWLRRKDKENHRTARSDREAYYAKKNLDIAIRMVAFLNDSPLISRDNPAASISAVPINMLGGVVAPIVNMVRHEEFLQERQRSKRGLELSPEFIEDIQLVPSAAVVKFKIRTQYEIHYDGYLQTIDLMVNQYRLQQVFYNLFSNASKFRGAGKSLVLRIEHRRDTEFEASVRPLFSDFYVIDVIDHGVGIPEGEEELIFQLGYRGSRSAGTKGTGRGLYFVRETMLSIGGEVAVWSRANPTIIRLLIPVACKERDWHRTAVVAEFSRKAAELRNLMLQGRTTKPAKP